MIIAILGGIGSGKSVYTVKKALDSRYHSFVNFDLNAPNVSRMKKEHVIKEIQEVGVRGKVKTSYNINWEFWNKAKQEHKDFNLMIDEVANIFHSRKSMSTWNILATEWISQIRKVLGDSEKTHIYLTTQRVFRLDVAFRDLLHAVISCKKRQYPNILIPTKVLNDDRSISVVDLPLTQFIQYHFYGKFCLDNYLSWSINNLKAYDMITHFYGNHYFQFYNSYEIFGESAYL